jgi:hypothetical protein
MAQYRSDIRVSEMAKMRRAGGRASLDTPKPRRQVFLQSFLYSKSIW